MGKLIMPKHTGERVYFQTPLKVYYDANDWVTMRGFADQLFDELVAIGKEHLRNSDNTHYTKCAQLPRYFGLVKRKSAANDADARITPRGIKVYEALVNEDMASVHAALVEAMETMSFGRDNEGCGSDSDVEPLGVFFRCAYALDGLTGKEFGYILGELHEHGKSIGDVQEEVLSFRTRGLPPSVPAQSLASNLADCKTLKLLKELGFIVENTLGRMVVEPAVDAIYHNRLGRLRITNAPPLKKPFKKWLADNDYGVSIESYPRSIEAISMPLSDPMSKTTGSWEGIYEYVIGERPVRETFSVTGRHDFDRCYARFSGLMSKNVQPPVIGIPQERHQELIDYTLKSGDSMDKGRLYCAYNAYKDFLSWFSANKGLFGFNEIKEEIMENMILSAIRTKPFILLAGISGTGKSRLVRQLAKGCCKADSELAHGNEPGNFASIAVRSNWHDSTELIGYVSRLGAKPRYVITDFVRFLAKAWLYEDTPFFLCLDEMNLAPVEQYFAEYLSVVESRSRNGENKIESDVLIKWTDDEIRKGALEELFGEDASPNVTLLKAKIDADKGLRLPPNLIVMGTVNMDETTFSFSRKVLDRAMSFELNEVDMDAGLQQCNDVEYGSILADSAKASLIKGCEAYAADQALCDKVKSYLIAINERLDGTSFKIAYRTRDEMMIYCIERTKGGLVGLVQALDEATSMKILSRIEGDTDRITEAKLTSFRNLIVSELLKVDGKAGSDAEVVEFLGDAEKVKASACCTKLNQMIKTVHDGAGFVSFWQC